MQAILISVWIMRILSSKGSSEGGWAEVPELE